MAWFSICFSNKKTDLFEFKVLNYNKVWFKYYWNFYLQLLQMKEGTSETSN